MTGRKTILPRKLVPGDSLTRRCFPGVTRLYLRGKIHHTQTQGQGFQHFNRTAIAQNAHVEAEGEGRIIEFPGGLYAVAHCHVTNPGEEIPGTWQKLVRWRENNRYLQAAHQWLEEHIDPQNAAGGENFSLDLYLPIKE